MTPRRYPYLVLLIALQSLRAVEGEVEFNRDIRPILSENCYFCHGPDAAERKADLRLDTRAGATADLGGTTAIVPGDPEASELLARIHHADADSLMPPADSSRQLTEEQKETLKRWIAQGAEYQEHWAFLPPTSAEMHDAVHPVDHFIQARLTTEGLKPSPLASPERLVRRLHLDLSGLPPSIAAVDSFVSAYATDPVASVDARISELFATPAYAERMAWDWMEAARYADTDGYQNDGPRTMWPWRDWVIDAFRANMPFDQFTIEQLAGDLLADATHDQRIATGFNRNHRYNSESGLVQEEFLLENAVDRVDTTMTVWQGLTMGCARCHDHKYDPLSQRDYYQMVSLFDKIPESGRAIKSGNSEPWIRHPSDSQKGKLQSLEAQIAETLKEVEKQRARLERLQRRWEESAGETPIFHSTGLSQHLAVGAPVGATDGEPLKLGKLAISTGSQQRFSISLQVHPEQTDTGSFLAAQAGGTARKGFFFEFDQGHLRFAKVSRWIAGVLMIETEQSFAPGESFHVAVTNDGSHRAGGLTLYINGEKAPVRILINSDSNDDKSKDMPLSVGGSDDLPAWTGTIEDLRFYQDRTLPAREIAHLAVPATIPQILDRSPEQRSPEEAGKLHAHFLRNHAPEPWLMKMAVLTAAEIARDQLLDAMPNAMVMQEVAREEPTVLRIRGEYASYGEAVDSDIPARFGSLGDGANRLDFARWLVSSENPLTARVVVNRYWQMLFGRGLVKTAEDFGAQGELPSHPELLDHLAVQLQESDWDLQQLLRTLVTSHTYQQASARDDFDGDRDPENLFLGRAPRLKLSGSLLRDQALAASGLLVAKVGGPSVKPYQPAGLWKEASNFTYTQGKGDDLYRRSLYTYWKRTLAPPSMAVLDAADREWCSVKPKRTNTPLQALTLLNETAFFEAARKLGERILREGGEQIDEQVRFAFRSLLAREPTEQEQNHLVAAYGRYLETFKADPKGARATQTIGESPVPEDLDPIALAAATTLANILLNIEETSVRP